jgi:CDP-glucose 4,6-dehydratase
MVFHLAAQPLVRKSFDIPLETFEVNTLGTVNLLECIRRQKKPCVVVCVTTDKCYENREWLHSYRENDPMGGFDPYSASKGCAELVIDSYRNSFFLNKSEIMLASARAGNVIGGGDWAIDRIVPDIFRSLFTNKPVLVRNKHATRPWQHVLEPLSGYLWLAASLYSHPHSSIHPPASVGEGRRANSHSNSHPPASGGSAASAGEGRIFGSNPHTAFPSSTWPLADLQSGFNFGPSLTSNRPVEAIVKEVLKHIPGDWHDASDPNAPHEASNLNLAIDKAFHILGWQPVWDFEETVLKTADWYQRVNQGENAVNVTMEQIANYAERASLKHLVWAR